MGAIRDIPGRGYGSPYVDSLIWGGKAWDPGQGPIKYLFGNRANFEAASKRHGFSAYIWDAKDIESWTADEISAFKSVLSLYAKVSGLTFAPAGSVAEADIVWWKSDLWDGVAGVHEPPLQTPAWGYFNPTETWKNLKPGGDGRNTIIHEIGHGLGLAHPHDGGWEADATRFPSVSTSADTGWYGLNQGVWTVMSYNAGWNRRGLDPSYGAQGGLGAFDIAAIQALYGPNLETALGGNVYHLPTRNAPGTGWSSIWDAGGIDTISGVHSRESVVIDLRSATLRSKDAHAGGYVSSQKGISGGFTIAHGVTIENAAGGAGNDKIWGNAGPNLLRGHAGDDALHGLAGDDVLQGRVGKDILVGGPGHDTFVFDTVLDGKRNVDRIADFRPGEDAIRLDHRIFKALAPGLLEDGIFRNGLSAADGNDHILYDPGMGALSYDPDGSGARSPLQFAVLHTHLVMNSHDFLVT
ncbi:M10 family metallopeptidase [Microvirga rosea]|uniref:M10 family metallopeptidase n=1 Tax=Microvirga rosea TaxID=2715425 RepID=UPI001D0B2F76|nr:M10 family metallopeptidase [Microvirga rosea]MCB8820287.1 M10 family metallopeptidase C-terminal domain-containing protein [Microvirga rosea]